MIDRLDAIRVAPELSIILEPLNDSWEKVVRWAYRFNGDTGKVYMLLCRPGASHWTEGQTEPLYSILLADVAIRDGQLDVTAPAMQKCAESLEELLALCPSEYREVLFPDDTCNYCGDMLCGVTNECDTTVLLREVHRPKSRPSTYGPRSPDHVTVAEMREIALDRLDEPWEFAESENYPDIGLQLKLDAQAAREVQEACRTGQPIFEIGENLDD